ncbi:unnamed protein product [Aureobasidium uvarum]|uniref:Uncharacterized protein n=1 Tax=Aureobasidium uvarum TaxID=2773716 RepID=A0A9N8PVE8_9PEZI|nr:unnamed protein product [Aureobasidium uvarum]
MMKREASSDDESRPAAKQARLSSNALYSDNNPPLKIKPSMKSHFEWLCREFGWAPNELTREKIMDLLGMEPGRNSNVEAALFAFVQHLSFVWNDDALLIGSKQINNIMRTIWYRPLGPGASVGDSLWLNERDKFDGGKIHKYSPRLNCNLVDRIWPSFTTAFDLSSYKGDYRYISGVHTILLTFPKLRKSCGDRELRAWVEGRMSTATEHTPLRKYELPFLPESVWMSKPFGSLRPQPITPSEGSSSRPSPQSSPATTRRSSVRELDRIQNILQGQRKQLGSASGQQDKRSSESGRLSISESVEKSPEPSETTEATSQASTEVIKNDAPGSDLQSPPMGYIDLTTNDHVNQLLQQNGIEVALGTPDRLAQANVQLTVTFPARIAQNQPQPVLEFSSVTSADLAPILPSALEFSLVTSVDSPPVMPSRRAVLEALCALAMNTMNGDTQ